MASPRMERIEHLLQKHDLYVKYQYIFQRYIVCLKDAKGNELWHYQHFDTDLIRDEMCDYLEQYDKEQEFATLP